jgi:hypothetical protein
VVAVIACHDHQLKIAVAAIGACDPVRVHDLDATRFLARSRHVPSVETSACRNVGNCVESNAKDLLPQSESGQNGTFVITRYYTYSGSLTTPPCSEPVRGSS